MTRSYKKLILWKKRIKRYRSSGLSIRKWCRENNVAYSTFQYWYTKIRQSRIKGHQRTKIAQDNFTELKDSPPAEVAAITLMSSTIPPAMGFSMRDFARDSFERDEITTISEVAGIDILIGKSTIRLHKGFDKASLTSCLCILGG